MLLYIIAAIKAIYDFFQSLFAYRSVYIVGGLFATRKFPLATRQHKYAVLVAARNEETVIGNLIDSIRAQDYPSELVDIFVVADNCTDATADISRQHGAICYERFDEERRTKGFALQLLVECIRQDYGIDHYEGYFVFDADNLLKKDFISRMNDSFDAGEKIVTSYRNTKNFDDNFIAASYGIHWLRTVRFEHRARSVFHLATRIQGTGFLFASEVIQNGWNYTGFTEDRAFCADAVANGYRISYNDEAEFYDEQPTNMRIALRQRIRWSKGHLQAVAETGPTLFRHLFVTRGAANRHLKDNEGTKAKRFLNNLRLRFMSYDMLSVVVPYGLIGVIRTLSVYVLQFILILMSVKYFENDLAPGAIGAVLNYLHVDIATEHTASALILLTLFIFAQEIISGFSGIATAVYVFIIERKRIMKIAWYKKIWFCVMFPLFDIIGKITDCIALFKKVEWKPIPHITNVTIEEVNQKIHVTK